jgi:hypothetical protein
MKGGYAAERRMRSPRRSTAQLVASLACWPRERVRTDPEGSDATVTAQTTVSQIPMRSSRRRTTRAPRTLERRGHLLLRVPQRKALELARVVEPAFARFFRTESTPSK